MQVIITGGTGFIGRALSRRLLDQGHAVTALGTRDTFDLPYPGLRYIQADTTLEGSWQAYAAEADLVFNLAGRTVFHRWTKAYKQKMIDSRVLTTRNLVSALSQGSKRVLVSASAVGFYGNGGETVLTEDAPNGDDFLAKLSRDWEDEASAAAQKGYRVILGRFGIVLGRDGGALQAMLPAYRTFVGGPIGDGRQWFPWIHLEDLIEALLFAADATGLQGPVNMCSPNPVRNRELAHKVGKVINRPAKLAVPTSMLRLLLGEMTSALVASQREIPQKLIESGFEYQYPELENALTHILT